MEGGVDECEDDQPHVFKVSMRRPVLMSVEASAVWRSFSGTPEDTHLEDPPPRQRHADPEPQDLVLMNGDEQLIPPSLTPSRWGGAIGS